MLVQIRLTGDTADLEVLDLREWLSKSPEVLRALGLVQSSPTTRPGELGDALDLINFLVSSVLDTAALLTSIAAWRDARRPNATITISRDDVTVSVTSAEPLDIQRLTQILFDEDET
jgi:hypothetical protein